MFGLRVLGASGLLAFSAVVSANSFVEFTDVLHAYLATSVEVSTVEGTTGASAALAEDKRIVDARDDAASFVATGGEIRGVQLEAALEYLRAQPAAQGRTDLELAQAIVAR